MTTLPVAGGFTVGAGVGVGNGGREPIGLVASAGTSASATSGPRELATAAVAFDRARTSGRTVRSAAAPARIAGPSVGDALRASASGAATVARNDSSWLASSVARRQV